LLIEDEEGFTRVLITHGVRLADLAPIVTRILASSK
jgi:hypothetical protein